MNLSEYLSTVGNRDKVFGVLQFAPVLAAAPAASLGNAKLAEGLLKAAKLAEGYRTITRFSGMIDMLQPKNFQGLAQVKDPIMRKVALLEFICTFCFFPYEHLAMFATYNVLPESSAPRYAGMAVFFWFYSLVIRIVRETYCGLLDYPHWFSGSTDAASIKRRADLRKRVLVLIKSISYAIFAWSLFPVGKKPQLLTNPRGVLYPVHRTIEMLTPTPIDLSGTTRGVLGMIAAVTEFL